MKKTTPALALILLLSLTGYSQKQFILQSNHEKQFNTDNYLSKNTFPKEYQECNSPSKVWLLMDRAYSFLWNTEHSGWKNTTTYFYYYDANYNLDEIIEKSADGSEFIERNRYYYDNNNLLLEKRISEYDSSEWIPSKKILYTYNVNNDNLIQELTKKWEDEEYVDYRKATYTYDSANNLYQIIAKYSNDGSNWYNSARWTYFYDQNDYVYKMTNETYDFDDSVWTDLSRNFLTRDIEGNLILMISEYWNDENNIWEEKLRQTYYYNDDNRMTLFVAKSWDDDDNVWKPVFSRAYTYLPAGSKEIMVLNADLNKTIEDFQTTEDDLIIDPGKNPGDDLSLIGVEVIIDSVIHTSDGDLEFTLTHNDISETIIYQAGGDGDNFINTKLSDRGVDTVSNGIAPFLGIYKPENPLSVFLETDPSGTWTLSIYDGASENTGILYSWGINLIYGENMGIENKLINGFSFEIYPNPANEFITLQSDIFTEESSTLEIFDINGRKIIEQHIPKGISSTEIKVKDLANGMYFCMISSENYSTTRKLIIQK